jgi:hypothetical protein
MSDNRGFLKAQVFHQPPNIVGHRALVTAARPLVSRTVAAQTRHEESIMLRQRGDLGDSWWFCTPALEL